MVKPKIPVEVATFLLDPTVAKQEMWCDCCDHEAVDSKDTTTGLFFKQHGTRWNSVLDNGYEYVMIIWAICRTCLNNDHCPDGWGSHAK